MTAMTQVNDVERHLLKVAGAVTATLACTVVALGIAERCMHQDPNGAIAETIEQCKRWLSVAEQDSDVLLRYQHVVLALAYLNVARHLASDDVIAQVTHVHVRVLAKTIETQAQAHEKTISARMGENKRARFGTQRP